MKRAATHSTFNFPLWIGLALVAMFALTAILGPVIAPRNPMEQNYAIDVDGSIRRPPIAPLTHPDYPLGTDNQGRDMLSRILWAVRPTLIMVGLAAAIRLFLGILFGLYIGWGAGPGARRMESLMSSALSIPQLIVALIGVTAIGIERGLLAFIFGFSLNGWAETARIVTDQTRILKKQIYIEAAQALGASNRRILFTHILNHILPLTGMLAAFEISAIMLLSAELGFLGYYVGGGIYVEITDFVTENVTGLPELGQMLATSLTKLTDPSVLLMTGSVMLVAILGFNLLGEGLRREMGPERLRGSWMEKFFGSKLADWLETNLSRPILTWLDAHPRLVSLGIAALLAGLGFVWWTSLPRADSTVSTTIIVPGNHFWASERRDAQGTRRVEVDGIHTPTIAQAIPIQGGATGAPAIDSSGMVYLSAKNNRLLALLPNVGLQWESGTPEIPVGGPALGADGTIYLTGEKGGLMAFSHTGELLWHWKSEVNRPATSGAIIGPSGSIYYTVIDRIYALSPAGSLLWKSSAVSNYLERPPTLSPDGNLIFLERNVYTADSGQKLGITPPVDPQTYPDQTAYSGANGGIYFRTGHEIRRWRLNEDKVAFEPPLTWTNAQSGAVALFPTEQGTSPDGSTWLFYSSLYTATRLIWLDAQGRTLNNAPLAQIGHQIIAFDKQSTLYACTFTNCIALSQTGLEPSWDISLRSEGIAAGYSGPILGGALAEKTLYVVTQNTLFVIQEQEP
jgi:ABC-type dipeptide/oligopeptide/nickel transport system permease subunit